MERNRTRTTIEILFTFADGRKVYWRPVNMKPWTLPGGIVARRVDRRSKYQKKGKVKGVQLGVQQFRKGGTSG